MANPTYKVFINGRAFEVSVRRLSALQLRSLAGLPPDTDLVIEGSGATPDRIVSPGERVELTLPTTHFFTRPVTTFG